MTRHLVRALAVSTLVFAVAACGPGKKKEIDYDAKSGLDKVRDGATLGEVNKPANGDVNMDKFDQTDYWKFELKGKAGVLAVDMHWDRAEADLNCDVFNSFGEQIAASPGPQPGTQVKKVLVDIKQVPATYYVRIQSARKGDFSVYTIVANWEGEKVPAVATCGTVGLPCCEGSCTNSICMSGKCNPPPTAAEREPVAANDGKTGKDGKDGKSGKNTDGKDGKSGTDGKSTDGKSTDGKSNDGKHHSDGGHGELSEKDISNGIQGRIVQSYKEGGSLVLHLDKGSAAGIKVGNIGTVLEGPSGESALNNGGFKVVQVVDEQRSVAKCSLKSIGRNSRVAIKRR